jgi:hypothetical protein
VGYLVTSLFIARPGEIMVTGKVKQTLNLLIVSTEDKLSSLNLIALFKAEERKLMEMELTMYGRKLQE